MQINMTPLMQMIRLLKTFARQYNCTVELYDTAKADDLASYFMEAYCL